MPCTFVVTCNRLSEKCGWSQVGMDRDRDRDRVQEGMHLLVRDT
jgi:hypothetical protein